MTRCEISVIVPTYARPKQIQQCLRSLSRLDFPREAFEVVVVDDGSPQPVKESIRSFHRALNLTWIRKNNAGPASARNAGAEVASGRYLAFTDDDCRPTRSWLRELHGPLADHSERMVGGLTINRLTDNPFSIASQTIVDIIYQHYNQRSQPIGFFTSNNMALHADSFRRIGGFDETFPLAAAEDREICDRWLALGQQLVYRPQAIVQHVHRLRLGSFARQHVAYGRGAKRYHEIRAQRGSRKLSTDLEFHAQLLKRLRQREPRIARLLDYRVRAALMLSQVAYLLGYGYERFRSGRSACNDGVLRSAAPDATQTEAVS